MKPRHSDFSRSQRATERVQTPWIPWTSVYPKLSYSANFCTEIKENSQVPT